MAIPLADKLTRRRRPIDARATNLAIAERAATTTTTTPSLRRIRAPRGAVVGHYALRGTDNQPVIALTASAQTLHGATVTTTVKRAPTQDWQQELWQLRREIGELRFVGDRQARALSQARLFIAKVPESQDADPEPVTDGPIAALSRELFGSRAAVQQSLERMGQHLDFNGESIIVVRQDQQTQALFWSAHSVQEITGQGNMMKLNDGVNDTPLSDDDLVVRCWKPDPEYGGLSTCSAQSVLPVARELKGLTQHTAAQIDSRLAGNGLLILPQTVEVLAGQASTPNEGDEDADMDEFVRSLVESMTVPMTNRDSASSVVPLVIRVPDDVVDKIQHLTFATPFDEMAKDMREENIRRVGLGMDSDPSVLLGLGSGNHWSAWLVTEDEQKLVIAPMAATVCHAFTAGVVRPLLEQVAPTEDPSQYLVWFDLGALELRPDKSADARTLHDAGLVSDAVALRENGFDPNADKPTPEEYAHRLVERLLFAKPDLAAVLLPYLGIEIELPDAAAPADPGPTDPAADAAPVEPNDGQDRNLPDTRNDPPPAASTTPGPGDAQ